MERTDYGNLGSSSGLADKPGSLSRFGRVTFLFVLALIVASGPIGIAFAIGRAWITTNLGWFEHSSIDPMLFTRAHRSFT